MKINSRVRTVRSILTPEEVKTQYGISKELTDFVNIKRGEINSVLKGDSKKLLVIVGPCSIHDVDSAVEYACLLKNIQSKLNNIVIIMRAYLEKPRTTLGWKGFINDPFLNQTYDINSGLIEARKLYIKINSLGIPLATEILNLPTVSYFDDLISWAAIGARTVESQVHREFSSSMPFGIGFKNSTSGDTKLAADAIAVANSSHTFISCGQDGKSSILTSEGNDCCNLILRGGETPNYDYKSVNNAIRLLKTRELNCNVIVDYSHSNCNKNYKKQIDVNLDICNQIISGNFNICGVMLESNLFCGRQDFDSKEKLQYGVSLTDPCLGWEDTENVIMQLSNAIKKARGI